MGLVNKPFTMEAFKTAFAAQANANWDVLFNEFNGNVSDPNISVNANIQQSKIANLVTNLAQKVQEVNVVVFGINGTYTKPADLLFLRVIAIGGGGGGGGPGVAGAGTSRVGGGGGGGGYAEAWYPASSISSTHAVTIGAAGAGGFNGQAGNVGGVTTVTGLASATGGIGGDRSPSDSAFGIGGTPGIGTLGQILTAGGAGHHGMVLGAASLGGNGGDSALGGGGRGAFGIGTVGDAGNTGGGGGGGGAFEGTVVTGGPGGGGLVIFVEYKS